MAKRKNLIEVPVKRLGTIFIEITPRLRRLRSEIGRLNSLRKRLPTLLSRGRITERECKERIHYIGLRLQSLRPKMQGEMKKAVEERLREMTRYSTKTTSAVLIDSGPPKYGWIYAAQAGLPGLGKKR